MNEPMKSAISQSGKHYPLTPNTRRFVPRNHAKDREAREHYESRASRRPIQITAPTSEHVIGWNWPKVSEATLVSPEWRENDFEANS